MANAKDITIEDIQLTILTYGPSGTGKTSFACSFRKAGPVYVADFDKGMLGQRGLDVEYDTFTNYQDWEVKLAELEAQCSYDTVVLDSVTTMQEYKMDRILQLSGKKTATQYEWMLLINDLRDLFMRLTKLSKNVVVIAHEQMVQDGITGEIMVMPVIYGKKLPAQLPLWFDEVYHFGATKDKEGYPLYYFDTVAQDKYMGKSRLNVLPPRIEWSKPDPNQVGKAKPLNAYELIMSYVKGGAK